MRRCDKCEWWSVLETNKAERESLQKEVDAFDKTEFDAVKFRTYLECKEILDAGYCKRFPPTINCGEGEDWFTSFPKTQITDWCGEFKEKQ